MFPTTLPNNAKVTAAENSSTYHPTGMLDRDQRTTFQIEKTEMNSIHLSQLGQVAQCNHHHQQNNSNTTTKISARCKNVSQTKDNNETVMCPLTKNIRKFDINRTRTKFPVAFQVIALIIFLTINITYSKAKPLNSQPIECNDKFITALSNNKLQTNFTMVMLGINMGSYINATNAYDVAQYDHYGDHISNTSTNALENNQSELKDVITTSIQHIYDLLFNATQKLDFFICRHSNPEYVSETMHYMNFNNSRTKNNGVSQNLSEIREYTNLSMGEIIVLSKSMSIDLVNKTNTIEDCFLFENISVASEIITMKKLEGTLTFMNIFFDYIQKHTNCANK